MQVDTRNGGLFGARYPIIYNLIPCIYTAIIINELIYQIYLKTKLFPLDSMDYLSDQSRM